MSIAFQQGGWFAHDVIHHQVFKNRSIGTGSAYFFGNFLTGFSVQWWKHKHGTHHASPNVHLHDPDIDTMPFLAWSEHALEGFKNMDGQPFAKFMVKYQKVLVVPLLGLARMSWLISSILVTTTTKPILYFPGLQTFEKILLALHYVWYFGIPFAYLSPIKAIAWILTSQVLGGLLLSAVFVLNHVRLFFGSYCRMECQYTTPKSHPIWTFMSWL